MKELINTISQLINPNTAGLISLTDENLTLETKGLYEINYLFNGLLIKSIMDKATSNDLE